MLKVQILTDTKSESGMDVKVDMEGDFETIVLESVVMLHELIKTAEEKGIKDEQGNKFSIHSILSLYSAFKEDN